MLKKITAAPDLSREQVQGAVADGNIPSLLPVLFHLTGEERWLREPYVPVRTRGFEELDSGGLPEPVQQEIRDAAVEAIMAWSAGRDAAVPEPSDAQLTQIMSACMGEPIPADYAPMIAEQLGFRPFVPETVGKRAVGTATGFSVGIIGSGVSGLACGFALKAAGVDFTIIEKNDDVGGTWLENRYPGARVDIPSNLYSYSFAPQSWSEHFGRRDEIWEYLRGTTERFDIRPHIRFGTEVQEARWDEEGRKWVLQIVGPSGEAGTLAVNAIVTATGLHNRPKIPSFPGQDLFAGEVIHSARWPENAAIDGRKVAVVGTGASAMQIVNSVAGSVENLLILQRSPQWIAPNENYFTQTPEHTHFLFKNVPYYREWYRFRLYWLYTERMYAGLLVDPNWNDGGKSVSKLNNVYLKFFTSYLKGQLEGRPDLQEKTLPDYPPFGKRILLDNGWFETLRQPNVELLTDGISELTKTGLITSSGQQRDVDTVVLCTGFEQQRFLYPIEFYGRGGKLLRDEWDDDDARAYLGISSPGFPNLFYLFGPNTNPPSGSYFTTAEAQVRYVTKLLTTMVRDGIGSVECKVEPFIRYNNELDAANNGMVYAQDNVHNYYRNARGRVVTNSPWPVLKYWSLTQQPDLSDYTVTMADDIASSGS